MSPSRILLGIPLLLALAACGHPGPTSRPHPSGPHVGLQVWNDGPDPLQCTVTLVPEYGDATIAPRQERLEIPPVRRFDPALGGDPEAAQERRFPVADGVWRLRLETPSGSVEVTLDTRGRNWLIASVGSDQVSGIRDTGPRRLE